MQVTVKARKPPRIAFVMGDPAGISPELAAKLLADEAIHDTASLLVIGDRRDLAEGEKIAGVDTNIQVVSEPRIPEVGEPLFYDLRNCNPADVTRGQATKAGGAAVMSSFRKGLELARDGMADVVFFTPFNKQALRLAGNPYLDEIHFAADVLGHTGPCSEFNILGNIWNARVTSHIAFKDVLKHITEDNVLSALTLTDKTMRQAGSTTPGSRSPRSIRMLVTEGHSGTRKSTFLRRPWRVRARRALRSKGRFLPTLSSYVPARVSSTRC